MSRPTDRPDSGPSPGLSQCDVRVIGGGPAGPTSAALQAREGRDVAVFEKSHHPRSHIGESLLPANVALFDRLGLRAEVESIGISIRVVEAAAS